MLWVICERVGSRLPLSTPFPFIALARTTFLYPSSQLPQVTTHHAVRTVLKSDDQRNTDKVVSSIVMTTAIRISFNPSSEIYQMIFLVKFIQTKCSSVSLYPNDHVIVPIKYSLLSKLSFLLKPIHHTKIKLERSLDLVYYLL